MIKEISNAIKNVVFGSIFIYTIFAIFLGIQEANNIVINVIHAFIK